MAVISVLITVYNCEQYLKRAVDSILNQTWSDFEIIIVDDGSTDNSLQIIKGYDDARIKIIAVKENRGVAYARNIGMKQCRSDYIALMDADDISLPNRLEMQYEFLKEHPEIDGVYAKYQHIDVDDKIVSEAWPVAYHNYKYVKAYMLLNNTVANCGMMFRRQIVERYHLRYDEDWKIASDYKFWCDYLKHGKIVGMDNVLWYYRLRNHSLYNNSNTSVKEAAEREIKLYVFQQYGFHFSEEEQEVLINVFGIYGKIASQKEMILLHEALWKMANQAAQNKLEFAEEVRIMCRKRFLEKVKEADGLWILDN